MARGWPRLRARPLRWFGLVLFLLSLLRPQVALAWVESHVARDDVRLVVQADGTARVEHKILLLVSGGPLKGFTVRGVDADAVLDRDAFVQSEQEEKSGSLEGGLPIALTLVKAEGGRTDIEAKFDGRGISRGRFVATVRYQTNLAQSGALRGDGASARLDWVGAEWDDGLETTRAVFVVPAGRSEPAPIDRDESDDSAGAQGTYLSKVTKQNTTDTIEVMRAYAARGERVAWSLRLDRQAFPFLSEQARAVEPNGGHGAQPTRPRSVLSPGFGDKRTSALWLVGLLGLVLTTALWFAHAIDARQRADRRGDSVRPLLPLPAFARALLGGGSLVGGVYVQLTSESTLFGSLLVAAASLTSWHLLPKPKILLRGPGTWLAVRPSEAFLLPPRRRSPFDVRTWPGVCLALVMAVGVGVAVHFAARWSPHHAVLLGFDAVPLLLLFLNPSPWTQSADPIADPVPLFRSLVERVQRNTTGVRVVPRLRFPQGQRDADELRVVFLPPRPAKGLRSIELGAAYAPGPLGHVELPEILVRFEAGSECERMLTAFDPGSRAQRGRRPDERVMSFAPKLPTTKITGDLLLAILSRLTQPEQDKNVRMTEGPSERQLPVRRARAAAAREAASAAG